MGYAQQNSQKSVVDGYAEAGAIATEGRGALAVFRSAIPLLSTRVVSFHFLVFLAALASSFLFVSGAGIHCGT